MTVSEFDVLLHAAMANHYWFRMDCLHAKRREILSALADECQLQIDLGSPEGAEYIGIVASRRVRNVPLLIPDWLAIPKFEELSVFVARHLLTHPHQATDFALGGTT